MESQELKSRDAGRQPADEREPAEQMNNVPEEEKESTGEEKKDSFKKVFWEYAQMIAIVLILVILLQNFVFINARIPSASMENTVMTGDRIFGSRLAYTFGEPERYDIAIFRYPDDESKLFIKRVIGLPGETVTIQEDGIYINDSTEPLSEAFCPEKADYEPWIGQSWTVPEGCYFMLGDNRNYSGDSRYWNNPFVAQKKILAKAGFRYWPLNQISVLDHGDPSYYQPEGETE